MRLKLDAIAAFHAVVETGSISAAARRLGVAKSVVSKRVTELEAGIAATLLKRSTRSVLLTENGQAFYERTRALLGELEDAANAVGAKGAGLRGTIRLAAPMSFGTLYLGQLLWPFLARHPELEVAVDLDDKLVDLLGLGYDLGLRIGRLADSSLIGRRLAEVRVVLCASPEYLARRGTPRHLEDLASHDCIGYAHLTAGQVWQFEAPRLNQTPRSIRVKGRFVANNGELMRDAAIAGLGLACLPEFMLADALSGGRLVALLESARPLPSAVYALYPRDRQGSPRVTALVEHLASALSPPPWAEALA
jgi:DNA-binding transcriptional LysR family regulator